MTTRKPLILAPAGDVDSFLAAIAAKADAVYCGLKIFSARMEASNFSIEELSRLTALAQSRGIAVHVALNTLIKPNEIEKTENILAKLVAYVRPHALIVQDLAVVRLARHLGFKGEIHLSTLANSSFPAGLEAVKQAGFDRVVLPRELNVDEIKTMAEKTPEGLDLEVFVHGALCYGVSGRCYWSSWFGGKGSLRGRCVQPCRRVYSQKGNKQRFFSCLDFSADVLAKVLKTIPEVTTWKIEGRKKSPHYVFYTVKAYRMLRDHGQDPEKKRTALAFLEYAMGRPSTHYNLLPQRPQNPLKSDVETGSGLFAGRVKVEKQSFFVTREALCKGDLLRIGYEDGKGHSIQRVTRSVPKRGKLVLRADRGTRYQKGDPVFIVDRRERAVYDLIRELNTEFEGLESPVVMPQKVRSLPVKPKNSKKRGGNRGQRSIQMTLTRTSGRGRSEGEKALWLSEEVLQKIPNRMIRDTWWWLSPVMWPGDEAAHISAVNHALAMGAKRFVLNVPWQRSFFADASHLELWAGPFCNIANIHALEGLRTQGFSGAFASPELGEEGFLSLAATSPISLGVVVAGNWPLAISRIVSDDILLDTPFESPMREQGWVSRRDGNFWVYPGWRLDLTSKIGDLQRAGYALFAIMEEPVPKGMTLKQRPGLWNWDHNLL
jgi:putative protease